MKNTWKSSKLKLKNLFSLPFFNPFYLEVWKLLILSQTYIQKRKFITFGWKKKLVLFLDFKIFKNLKKCDFWAIRPPKTHPKILLSQKLIVNSFSFGRGYLPEPLREIRTYLPEPLREIRTNLPEPLREIRSYLPEPLREIRTYLPEPHLS